jgi:hypothetical protein
MQMPATVPVCADEHIKQTTVYPANLRRQTPRIDPLGFHEISTPVVTSSEFSPGVTPWALSGPQTRLPWMRQSPSRRVLFDYRGGGRVHEGQLRRPHRDDRGGEYFDHSVFQSLAILVAE